MKKIQFTADVFDNGAVKYAKGSQHEATSDTERWVRRGSAVEVEVKSSAKGSAKDIAKAKKALAAAEARVAEATELLNNAPDDGVDAAKESLIAAEADAATARQALAELEGEE